MLREGCNLSNEELNFQNLNMLSEVFSRLLQEAVYTTTGFLLTIFEYKQNLTGEDEIIGTLVMSGKKNLLLMLSADENSARKIVSYMTGIETKELSEAMLCDGITEIVNIVGGGARIAFENTEFKFSMSVPFTITGKNVDIVAKRRTERYTADFINDDIKLCFKIFEL